MHNKRFKNEISVRHQLIDSHQHFWHYDPAEHVWMTDEMEDLKRDILPEDLEPILERAGYDGTITVQARQNLEETEWLLWLAGKHDFIKGVVGWVDLRSPGVREDLEKYASNPYLKGVRHVVHDEPDDEFMLLPDFLEGLGRLAAFDLTYDLLLFPRHIPVARKVVEMFPDQKFLLDHVAKPDILGQVFAPWDRDLKRLAASQNVACKLSGMVTEAKWRAWKYDDFVPVLDTVFECFGPERLMIGSDWPVCTLSAGYEEVMGIVEKYLEPFSSKDRDRVLGGNAMTWYGIAQ